MIILYRIYQILIMIPLLAVATVIALGEAFLLAGFC